MLSCYFETDDVKKYHMAQNFDGGNFDKWALEKFDEKI